MDRAKEYALVALGVFRNVHLAEDAEGDKIAEEDEKVDKEEEPRLQEERSHRNECHKST